MGIASDAIGDVSLKNLFFVQVGLFSLFLNLELH